MNLLNVYIRSNQELNVVERIKVLAADDHTLFRKGTVMLLKTFPEVGEVYEATNGQEVLQKLDQEDIDIVLMDLDMPVLDGIETSKKALSKYPKIHIIVVSMIDSLSVISDLIEIGVHSYLIKDAEPSEVHRAILSVINKDFYYNQIVARALHQKVQKGVVANPIFKDRTD